MSDSLISIHTNDIAMNKRLKICTICSMALWHKTSVTDMIYTCGADFPWDNPNFWGNVSEKHVVTNDTKM